MHAHSLGPIPVKIRRYKDKIRYTWFGKVKAIYGPEEQRQVTVTDREV